MRAVLYAAAGAALGVAIVAAGVTWYLRDVIR